MSKQKLQIENNKSTNHTVITTHLSTTSVPVGANDLVALVLEVLLRGGAEHWLRQLG